MGRFRPPRFAGWTGGLLTVLAVALVAAACGSNRGPAGTGSTVASSLPASSVHVPATNPVVTTTTALTAPPTTVAPTTTTTAPAVHAAASPTSPSPAPVAAAASTCPSTLASSLATTGSARQLVTVEAPRYDTTYASLETWERSGACWVAVSGPWSARIGENGFSDHHIEGDGTSPAGMFPISSQMYGTAPDPGVKGSYHRLVCGDWWDEDPRSPTYNTFQHVPCGTTPTFGGGSEALWKQAAPYPSFAVVEFNTDPAVPYAGSAIFLHADTGSPTDGCVSLPLGELDRVLRWLDPAAAPIIVMAPAQEISRF